MRLGVLAVMLCACNSVFGIDETTTGVEPGLDSDGDGTPDVDDNCPALANASQADEDRDGVGNACDNCPIVPNADQQDVGETDNGGVSDGIGDRCDPHPASHDCLIAFDSFDEPERFSAHWAVTPPTTLGTATPMQGGVVLSAPPPSFLGMELRDDAGQPILGKAEVQLVAQLPGSTGSLIVASNVTNARTGIWCGVGAQNLYFTLAPDSGASLTTQQGTYSPPLGDDLYFRLETTLADGSPVVACLAEYGISLRTENERITTAATGSPAVMVAQTTATVTGFTAYRNASTTSTCPTPLLR